MGRLTHFGSWLLQYSILSIFISFFWTATLKSSVFVEDSFVLIFLLTFLALESLFTFVWALRPLTSTPRMAIVVMSFAAFLSFYFAFAFD